MMRSEESPLSHVVPVSARGRRCIPTGGVPIYYVNLDRSVERMEAMQMRLEACGDAHRVRGFDKLNFNETLASLETGGVPSNRLKFVAEESSAEVRLRDWSKAMRATPGEIALFMSHWKAVRQAYADGAAAAVFMEDDAVALPTAVAKGETLAELVAEADTEIPNWNMLRLQASVVGDQQTAFSRYLFTETGRFRKASSTTLVGTAVFMLSRRGIKRFLHLYTKLDELDHMDEKTVRAAADRMPSDEELERRLLVGKFDCARYLMLNMPKACVVDRGPMQLMNEVYRPLSMLYHYSVFEKSTGVTDRPSELTGRHEQGLANWLRIAVLEEEIELLRKLGHSAAVDQAREQLTERRWTLTIPEKATPKKAVPEKNAHGSLR